MAFLLLGRGEILRARAMDTSGRRSSYRRTNLQLQKLFAFPPHSSLLFAPCAKSALSHQAEDCKHC